MLLRRTPLLIPRLHASRPRSGISGGFVRANWDACSCAAALAGTPRPGPKAGTLGNLGGQSLEVLTSAETEQSMGFPFSRKACLGRKAEFSQGMRFGQGV
jgi:hypothetical protein